MGCQFSFDRDDTAFNTRSQSINDTRTSPQNSQRVVAKARALGRVNVPNQPQSDGPKKAQSRFRLIRNNSLSENGLLSSFKFTNETDKQKKMNDIKNLNMKRNRDSSIASSIAPRSIRIKPSQDDRYSETSSQSQVRPFSNNSSPKQSGKTDMTMNAMKSPKDGMVLPIRPWSGKRRTSLLSLSRQYSSVFPSFMTTASTSGRATGMNNTDKQSIGSNSQIPSAPGSRKRSSLHNISLHAQQLEVELNNPYPSRLESRRTSSKSIEQRQLTKDSFLKSLDKVKAIELERKQELGLEVVDF